jgi:hypothetical protein
LAGQILDVFGVTGSVFRISRVGSEVNTGHLILRVDSCLSLVSLGSRVLTFETANGFRFVLGVYFISVMAITAATDTHSESTRAKASPVGSEILAPYPTACPTADVIVLNSPSS